MFPLTLPLDWRQRIHQPSALIPWSHVSLRKWLCIHSELKLRRQKNTFKALWHYKHRSQCLWPKWLNDIIFRWQICIWLRTVTWGSWYQEIQYLAYYSNTGNKLNQRLNVLLSTRWGYLSITTKQFQAWTDSLNDFNPSRISGFRRRLSN